MTSPSPTARDEILQPRVFTRQISGPGVLTGALFFAFSLVPSLLPRISIIQGVVSGITFMVGYAIGATWRWAWNFLEIPPPQGRVWRIVVVLWYVSLAFLVVSGMWRHVGWQNNVRDAFGMDRVSATVWLTIIPVTIGVAALILIVARSLRSLFHFITRWLGRRLRRRQALLLGGIALTVVLWGLWSGVLVNGFFAGANQVFAPRDSVTDEGIFQPQSTGRSGSPESLVTWESLGRQGRNFVATGPTVEELNAYHGAGAVEPIRVYAGLKSAETPEARAELVLKELQRSGAFQRDVLVVATTTGTGFLEPNAVDSLEYVYNGDTAIAGVQYSYLPSWISLLADQDEVKETTRVVFDTVHDYWSTLPEDSRPEIYLYGLSLGSYGVESILTSIDVINEPIDGALLVGPPFVNPLWDQLVDGRDEGSSPSTPTFEQGRTVRFTNEESAVTLPSGEWGDTKVLYLQHASDPVTFFSPDLVLDEPDWLKEGQRGSDVIDEFDWFPFVTMWQVMMDLPAAGSVPEGFGHLYTRQANADAWIAVTEPDGWTEADTEALEEHLSQLPPAPE